MHGCNHDLHTEANSKPAIIYGLRRRTGRERRKKTRRCIEAARSDGERERETEPGEEESQVDTAGKKEERKNGRNEGEIKRETMYRSTGYILSAPLAH